MARRRKKTWVEDGSKPIEMKTIPGYTVLHVGPAHDYDKDYCRYCGKSRDFIMHRGIEECPKRG